MSGLLDSVRFQMWPVFFPFFEKTWMKAKVFHSPTGHGGRLGVSIQALFGFRKKGHAWVVRFVGDVPYKSPYGNAVLPVVVRKQESFLDFRGERLLDSHSGCRAGEAIQSANQEAPDNRQPAEKYSGWYVSRGECRRIEKDDFLDPFGHVPECRKANCTAPVMNDEPDAIDSKMVYQGKDVR